MFDHLFENRNTTITNLLKLGDCLGRSLRENIELFSIDSETKNVAYLSESGRVISGSYDLNENLSLNQITVQDSEIFSDNDIFDSYVDSKVSRFVGNLGENNFSEADNSFSEILSLWENRLKFENVKKRLDEKSCVFSDSQTIVTTKEFQHFLEIMPQITDFLEEEKEKVQQVQEIENAIKLSNSVSKAFNFPRLSYDDLKEAGSYSVAKGVNKSVYELICKQELVKKELLESKKNFEDVWATNPKIRAIAALIFEDSDEKVLETLVEAVIEVPYLALTTKRQLSESLTNAFSLTDHTAISTKDIKTFVGKIYEMKKPLKQVILSILNEKYGINIQNLKDTATFTDLANTQVVIFEALTRLAPKGSLVKSTLSEISNLLKNKNGVEVIDVNDVIQECFEACGYESFCEDFTLIESLSFEDILDSEMSVTELLERAKTANDKEEKLLLGKKKQKTAGEDNLSPEQAADKKAAEDDEALPASECDLEDDSIKAAEKPTPSNVKEENETPEVAPELEEPSEETPEDDSTEPQEKPLSKEEFLDALKDMDELLKGMSSEVEDEEVADAEEDEQEA